LGVDNFSKRLEKVNAIIDTSGRVYTDYTENRKLVLRPFVPVVKGSHKHIRVLKPLAFDHWHEWTGTNGFADPLDGGPHFCSQGQPRARLPSVFQYGLV
jgi:hypothetical protein